MDSVRPAQNATQLHAIANSDRLAILRHLMARPATLTQLASAFGTYPAKIRHHVMALIEADLVALAEERTTANYTERFYRATAPAFSVQLLLRPDTGADAPLMLLGSHDLAVQALADLQEQRREHAVATAAVGSLDGLIALRQGLADVAGCHLIDFASGQFNAPYVRSLFPDKTITMVTLARREQGLLVARGNPLGLRDVSDIVTTGARVVNRNVGSGTRLWFDHALATTGCAPADVPGYSVIADTHTTAAATVANGDADVALGVRAAALRAGLDFVGLFTERYDLIFDADRSDEPAIAELLGNLESRAFKRTLGSLAGYDATETGREERIAV